jgi:hypothetical protein
MKAISEEQEERATQQLPQTSIGSTSGAPLF